MNYFHDSSENLASYALGGFFCKLAILEKIQTNGE